MAALIRHAWKASSSNNFAIIRDRITGGTTVHYRHTAPRKAIKLKPKPKPKPTVHGPTLQAARESLASRGYLRSQDSYSPSNDVIERIDKICKEEGLKTANETRLDHSITRFKILAACCEEFDYSVPNSLLHTIETIADLRKFYLTPVNNTVPLDAMRAKDLPENLHIQYEYHRFHPDTDTMFGGKTAFPKSSTLVTGLKYKKKYPGHTVKIHWH